MDSLRSIHARVAALARHRSPEDPDVAAAREQLAVCRDETNARRALNSMPAEARTRLLDTFQGVSASV